MGILCFKSCKAMETLVKLTRIFLLTFVWCPIEVVKLLLARYVSPSLDRAYAQNLNCIMKEIGREEKDYLGSNYCKGYLKQWYRSRFLDLMKEAQLGKMAPNPEVVSLDNRKFCKLFDFQKKGRPLILNFGSCT